MYKINITVLGALAAISAVLPLPSRAENLNDILLGRADITTRCAAFYEAASEAEGKVPGHEEEAAALANAFRKGMDDAILLQEAAGVHNGGPAGLLLMDRKVAMTAIEQFQSSGNLDVLLHRVMASCREESEKTNRAVNYVLSKVEHQVRTRPVPRQEQTKTEERECPGLLTRILGIKPLLSCDQGDAMLDAGIAIAHAMSGAAVAINQAAPAPMPIVPVPMPAPMQPRPVSPPTMIMPLNGPNAGRPTFFLPMN